MQFSDFICILAVSLWLYLFEDYIAKSGSNTICMVKDY